MTTKQPIIEVQLVLNTGVAAQLHHAEQTILPLPSSHVPMELCLPLLLWILPSMSFPYSAPLTKGFPEPKQAKRSSSQLAFGDHELVSSAAIFCSLLDFDFL